MNEPTPAKKANPADKKIFVIDDDDSILSMLRTTFEVEGFQVRTARDGRDLLKKLQGFIPDLIVSDLMMPGSGGYDVLRVLQGDPQTARVPVFIITGSSMAESTKQVMQQEPNLAGYFQKPIRAESLMRQVHKKLNTLSLKEANEQTRPKPTAFGFDDVL